jgi:hypothetical protein
MGLFTVSSPAALDAPLERASARSSVPRWLDAIVRFAAFGVVALGLAGLPLALLGRFRALPVVLGVAVVFAVLCLLWRRWQVGAAGRRPPLDRSANLIGLLAVGVAVLSVVVNGWQTNQHLLVDGDPAVYGVTGALLAHTGGLTVPTYAGSLFGGDPTLNFAGPGYFATAGEPTLYPQFLHLFPALLAVAQRAGGTGAMLLVNPVLGGFALLAFFVFAGRLLRPVWALVAMTSLAVLLPQLHFTRDLFSEVPSQLLVFAGLALLWDVTGPRRSQARPDAVLLGALVAGLVLGGSTMTRVDAFFYLAPIAAALLLLRAGRAGLAVLAGMLISAAVGLADGYWGSPVYLRSTLAPLVQTAALLVVLGAAAYAVRNRPEWPARLGGRVALPAAGLTAVLAAFAWFVRPHVQVTRDIPDRTNATIAGLQAREHLPVDVPRAYGELTMQWLSWYLGPITLTLGVLGLSYYLYRLLRGRDARLAPFVLLTGAVTAVYVWKPGIFPVQYWASRRFLPVSFPGLILLALLLCQQGWEWGRSRLGTPLGRAVPAVAGLLGVSVLVVPLAMLPGATLVRNYDGMLPAFRAMCGSLLPTDVVLLVGGSSKDSLVQAVEGYCHVPAAAAGLDTKPANVQRVDAAARAHGRRLVLLSADPNPPQVPPGTTFRPVYDVTVPTEALAISHRPDEVFPYRVQLFAAVLH